jgi:PEP-CTERM motif
MTSLDSQVLDANGVWSGNVFDGNYDFVVKLDGQSHTFSNYSFTNDASFSFTVTAVPEPSSLVLLGACALGYAYRRRRKSVRVLQTDSVDLDRVPTPSNK